MANRTRAAARAAGDEANLQDGSGLPAEAGNGAGGPADVADPAGGGAGVWEGYRRFTYMGPTLPGDSLLANTNFIGGYPDVREHLRRQIEEYPQVERLIFPTEMAAWKQPEIQRRGTLLNKLYGDIVSAALAKRRR